MTTFNETLEIMSSIHEAKDGDYSPSKEFENFYESLRIGIPPHVGVFTRLMDKYTRACNLINGHDAKVSDERLEDTLLDLAVYAVIVYTIYRNENSLYHEKQCQCNGGDTCLRSELPEDVKKSRPYME